MADETQTLINTLIQSGLASSESEAKRMAESMMTTNSKVSQQFADRKDDNHMFAKEVQATQEANKPQERKKISEEPKVQSIQESNTMQSKIEELRNAALNPEPVNIQVDFQTPKTDVNPQEHSTINPEFSQQNIEQAKSSVNSMPSVDFKIPGFDNTLSINELSSNNQPAKQENFFSQEQTATDSTPVTEPTPVPIKNRSSGLESGFPTENASAKAQNNDFLQMKESPVEQQSEAPAQNTQRAPNTPERKATWTEEERKLKDQVDLSKVFNFNNK